MVRDALQPLGAALRLPEPPEGSRWIDCESCGEQWRLPEGASLCPDCQAQERREAEARRLQQWRVEHRDEVLAAAGVPPRLRRSLEITSWPRDPRQTDVDPERWRGTPWCITFQGEPGVGKSVLAVELAFRWLCADAELEGLWWVRGGVLVRHILQGGGDGRKARNTPLLILDDLGQGVGNATAWSILAEVLAERYDWQRPTLVTTNLPQSALESAHPALVDRLLDGLVCPLGGASRRG